MELLAGLPLLHRESLVAVDDSPRVVTGFSVPDHFHMVSNPYIGGKGKYIADFAKAIGNQPVFSGYQAGWIGLAG